MRWSSKCENGHYNTISFRCISLVFVVLVYSEIKCCRYMIFRFKTEDDKIHGKKRQTCDSILAAGILLQYFSSKVHSNSK